jgi:hypothetical protein
VNAETQRIHAAREAAALRRRQEALLDSARRAEIDRQLLPAAVTQPLNAPLE